MRWTVGSIPETSHLIYKYAAENCPENIWLRYKKEVGMEKVTGFIKKEAVLCIAILLALLSAWVVPPDRGYAAYIDFRTLAILFCLMSVMAGLQNIGIFRWIARGLLDRVKSPRGLILVLMLLCFFSSMLITNDVALLTFVPFTFTVLGLLGGEQRRRLVLPLVAMQTIAANLGSMLTPIGNPQNLYLYGKAGMPMGDFLLLMLPYALVSLALLLVWGVMLGRRCAGAWKPGCMEGAEPFRPTGPHPEAQPLPLSCPALPPLFPAYPGQIQAPAGKNHRPGFLFSSSAAPSDALHISRGVLPSALSFLLPHFPPGKCSAERGIPGSSQSYAYPFPGNYLSQAAASDSAGTSSSP